MCICVVLGNITFETFLKNFGSWLIARNELNKHICIENRGEKSD